VTSDWRTVGELARRAGLDPVPARSPQALAEVLLDLARNPKTEAEGARLRQHFLDHYGLDCHLEGMAKAMKDLLTQP
jgi:hypothetical protein